MVEEDEIDIYTYNDWLSKSRHLYSGEHVSGCPLTTVIRSMHSFKTGTCMIAISITTSFPTVVVRIGKLAEPYIFFRNDKLGV